MWKVVTVAVNVVTIEEVYVVQLEVVKVVKEPQAKTVVEVVNVVVSRRNRGRSGVCSKNRSKSGKLAVVEAAEIIAVQVEREVEVEVATAEVVRVVKAIVEKVA